MADGASGQSKVYFQQGSTELTVASGGRVLFEAGASMAMNATMVIGNGALLQFAAGAKTKGRWASFPLDLYGARLHSTVSGPGAILSTGTVPRLTQMTTADPIPKLTWASGASGASARIGWAPGLPVDFDSATGFFVDLFAERTSGANTPDILVRVAFGTATNNRGASAPGPITSTPAMYSIAVASGLANSFTPIAISVTVEAHANDAVQLYGGRVRYHSKIAT